MTKSPIPSLDAVPSKLGFGVMRLPLRGEKDSDVDFETAEKMVDLAYQNGVNYFDTAYPYHDGESEKFLGRALKKYDRDSFYLATKMPVWLCNSWEDMERTFNEQLDRLQVDYFDFYLLHAFTDDRAEHYKKVNAYEFVKQKKAEGKIRHMGFSFHGGEPLLAQLLEDYQWDFVQLQLNYIDWDLIKAKRLYEMVTAKGLPIVVMEPVRGGYLAGFNDTVDGIFKASAPDASIASWALRWVASLPNVRVVLSGMSAMEQVEDNLKTFEDFKPLTEEEYKVIDAALEELSKYGAIPCTGCRYCVAECPMGIAIPEIFHIYNDYKQKKSDLIARNAYFAYMPEEKHADHCIECGACADHCPQHIAIPSRLKEIHEVFLTIKK